MKKVELSDILNIAEYELKRPEIRQQMMQLKAKRRIEVGPGITYLFENYQTVWYQIQEVMRAERMVKEDAIQWEIRAYNELIPGRNQLSASMFIASGDAKADARFLAQATDLPQHTFLQINSDRITPVFDPTQLSEHRISSVQYVKFTLSEEQVSRFPDESVPVILRFDHPLYRHKHLLTVQEKRILSGDLMR